MKLPLLFALMFLPAAATAQGFTCNIGGRPACLDYGDTVCSSMGKCVSQNSSCFRTNQCDYEGFTCRSNVTACVNDYEDLRSDYNNLVDEHNDLVEELDVLSSSKLEYYFCIQRAGTIEAAKNCIP
jgi:hypothetical protein